MLNKIIKSILNPLKAIRYLLFMAHYSLRKRRGILVFVGMDPNGVFSFMQRGFTNAYGFEANPDRFEKLKSKFGHNSHVKLFNVAASDREGEVTFNISNNNNGASSSIGEFSDDWNKEYNGEKIQMIKSITVQCINLNTFLEKEKITFIDEYFSDIQGMDLQVLKTLKPFIDERRIGMITCEVANNQRKNVYKNLPDNSEKGFSELLDENYSLIAKGIGVLRDNRFDKIPDNVWEMDCKWALKKA